MYLQNMVMRDKDIPGLLEINNFSVRSYGPNQLAEERQTDPNLAGLNKKQIVSSLVATGITLFGLIYKGNTGLIEGENRPAETTEAPASTINMISGHVKPTETLVPGVNATNLGEILYQAEIEGKCPSPDRLGTLRIHDPNPNAAPGSVCPHE